MSVSVADRHKHTQLLTSYSATAAEKKKKKQLFLCESIRKLALLTDLILPCYFIYTVLERDVEPKIKVQKKEPETPCQFNSGY